MVSVLLVTQDQSDADRISQFLSGEKDIALEFARDGGGALEKIDGRPFSCVLLDYDLPDMNGLELLRVLRRRHPNQKILFLAEAEDERLFLGASTLGVMACVSKDKLTESMLKLYIRNLSTRTTPLPNRPSSTTFWGLPSQEVYQSLIETMNEGVIVVDLNRTMLFVNPRVGEIVGCPTADLFGTTLTSLLTEDSAQTFIKEWDRTLQGDVRRYECEILRTDGRKVAVLVSQTPSLQEAGRIRGGLLVITDISKQKRIERRLSQLSITDDLTGLLNRRQFGALIGTEFRKAQRYQIPLSCLMIDLDHFKKSNDTMGHLFGDYVLRETGQLIREEIRDHDILARFGGEEFVLLFPNIRKPGAAEGAERIRATIEKHPFRYKGQERSITVSIGISEAIEDRAENEEDLVRLADRALYASKQAGRNRVSVGGSR